MAVDAELRRRNESGDLTAWKLIADLQNTVDSLSTSTIDFGLRNATGTTADAETLNTVIGRLKRAVTLLTTIVTNTTGLGTEATLQQVRDRLPTGGGFATEQTLMQTRDRAGETRDNVAPVIDKFRRTLHLEPVIGEEVRREKTATDDYHGIAPDGSATSASVWTVVRLYKTANGKDIERVRARINVKWDERALGW